MSALPEVYGLIMLFEANSITNLVLRLALYILGLSLLLIAAMLALGKTQADGWLVTYATVGDGVYVQDVYQIDVARGLSARLFQITTQQPPILSPDGRFVLQSRDGFIRSMAWRTGAIHDIGPGNSPVWSPDSRYLAYRSFGNVYVVTAACGSVIACLSFKK